MIRQETLEQLWACYREIKAGNKLLLDMAERAKAYPRDPYSQRLKDAFGHGQSLQLGIPCGENGHRLLDVSPVLAESVIRSHIATKEAELIMLNEKARVEINDDESCARLLTTRE
jgi:hypothetical protein